MFNLLEDEGYETVLPEIYHNVLHLACCYQFLTLKLQLVDHGIVIYGNKHVSLFLFIQ